MIDIKQIKKYVSAPLSVRRLIDDKAEWLLIKPKKTGFKHAKDTYCQDLFQYIIERKDDLWCLRRTKSEVSQTYACVVSYNIEELIHTVQADWEQFINNIPIQYELLFLVLDKLKDVKYKWNNIIQVSCSFTTNFAAPDYIGLVAIKKEKRSKHYGYTSIINISFSKTDTAFAIEDHIEAVKPQFFNISEVEFDKRMFECILSIYANCRQTHNSCRNYKRSNVWK